MASTLTELDALRDKLKRKNPGWRIWYVPRATGPTIWCAQPDPILNADTPEDLQKDIRMTEQEWRDEVVRDVWNAQRAAAVNDAAELAGAREGES